MKLLVDGATGSNDLIAPLQKMGLPAEKAHLPFGDLAFIGRGEADEKLYIGIELKKLGDLVQSMCTTKRLQGHQLLGLVQDFDRRYLIIEGDYHHDANGSAVVFRGTGKPRALPGAPGAVAFEQEILNIQTRGGVWVRHTTTRRDTLRFICAVFRYWTDKSLSEHRSHLAVYAPDMDKGLFTPPSEFRKWLMIAMPGMGFAASAAVETYVGPGGLKHQLTRVLKMTEDEWAALPVESRKGSTKRFGIARAKKILEALR